MELFLVTPARTLQTSIYQNTKQLGKMFLDLWITMVLLAYRTAKVVQAWTQTSTAQSAFKTNQLASFRVSNRSKIKVLAMLLPLVTRKYKVYLMASNKTNESCILCLQTFRTRAQMHNRYTNLRSPQALAIVNLQFLSAQTNSSAWVCKPLLWPEPPQTQLKIGVKTNGVTSGLTLQTSCIKPKMAHPLLSLKNRTLNSSTSYQLTSSLRIVTSLMTLLSSTTINKSQALYQRTKLISSRIQNRSKTRGVSLYHKNDPQTRKEPLITINSRLARIRVLQRTSQASEYRPIDSSSSRAPTRQLRLWRTSTSPADNSDIYANLWHTTGSTNRVARIETYKYNNYLFTIT